MLQMTQDARELMAAASEIARLRGAAACTPLDVTAAALALSLQAGEPIGFTPARQSPEMLPMHDSIQQFFDEATSPVDPMQLIAAVVRRDRGARDFIEGR